MPGRRRDGRKLWAADREDAAAPAEAGGTEVNPKQRKVLDVQTSAGNAAATAMVQRRAKTAEKMFDEMDAYLRESPAKGAYAKSVLEYDAAAKGGKSAGKSGGGGGGSKSGGAKSGGAAPASTSKDAAWAKGSAKGSGGGGSKSSKDAGWTDAGAKGGYARNDKTVKDAAWAKGSGGGGSKSSKDAGWTDAGAKGGYARNDKTSKDADWAGQQASIWADATYVGPTDDERFWKNKDGK